MPNKDCTLPNPSDFWLSLVSELTKRDTIPVAA